MEVILFPDSGEHLKEGKYSLCHLSYRFSLLTQALGIAINGRTLIKHLLECVGATVATLHEEQEDESISSKLVRSGHRVVDYVDKPKAQLYLGNEGEGTKWAVYTADYFQTEVQRVKEALEKNWAPMYPGETPDSAEDAILFKAVLAKHLSPSAGLEDPALVSSTGLLKRARAATAGADHPAFKVPKVEYREKTDPVLTQTMDKADWAASRPKIQTSQGLTFETRDKERRKEKYLESQAFKAQMAGEKIVPKKGEKVDAKKLQISLSGWMGTSRIKQGGPHIIREWHSGALFEKLRDFQKVYYDEEYEGGTFLTDVAGRLLIYRSYIKKGPTGKALHDQFVKEAKEFAERCTQEKMEDILSNPRGQHLFCIAGYDRQNKQHPHLRPWHVDGKNSEIIDEYFSAPDKGKKRKKGKKGEKTQGPAMYRVSQLVNTLLRMHFPAIHAKYLENVNDIKKKYKGQVQPHFGVFWNFCQNSPREGVPRVHCMPHIDSKNIAIGICALYIYGYFNSKEVCWLCIWEAGVILELPAGVILLYPSALFYHFNLDLADLDIRITPDGSRPTPSSPKLGESGDGRGSCVWFNQATMFQTAKLPYGTLKAAKKAEPNRDFSCNTQKQLDEGHLPNILQLEELALKELE